MSRFTLRDLFWLTLVVAMGCAWWVDHAREYRRHRLEKFRIKLQRGAELMANEFRMAELEGREPRLIPDEQQPNLIIEAGF